MEEDRIKCFRCGMSFRIGKPHQGEHTFCAEPACRRPFWHARDDVNTVRCYVEPEAA